jgi:hypothetical protein
LLAINAASIILQKNRPMSFIISEPDCRFILDTVSAHVIPQAVRHSYAIRNRPVVPNLRICAATHPGISGTVGKYLGARSVNDADSSPLPSEVLDCPNNRLPDLRLGAKLSRSTEHKTQRAFLTASPGAVPMESMETVIQCPGASCIVAL